MKFSRLKKANDNTIGYESKVRNIETNQVGRVTWCSAWSDVVSILWSDGSEEDDVPVNKLELLG